MTSNKSTRPGRAQMHAEQPDIDRVVAHVNVSVTRYRSGALRADTARRDEASGRYTFERLSDPVPDTSCPYYMHLCLLDAALEAFNDVHDRQQHL